MIGRHDKKFAKLESQVAAMLAELKYIEGQFEGEVWICPQCSHEESTSGCDSHLQLKDFLAALSTTPRGEVG